MVTRLRPPEVSMAFKDQSYTLRDIINIDLGLEARRDVTIRGGRIDLVLEQRHQPFYKVPTIKEGRHIFKAVMKHALMSDNPSPRRGAIVVPSCFFVDQRDRD